MHRHLLTEDLTEKEVLLEYLEELMMRPSPTGMTYDVEKYVQETIKEFGAGSVRMNKGGIICPVCEGDHPLVLTAHLDTLGAMVRAVKDNGRLRYVKIGGFTDNALENENVQVHTSSGRCISGTVQSVHASRHVWGDTSEERRSDETLEIVLDERTHSRAETEALGIRSGDFISFDPRFTVTESGFIKSRFLDDKAAAAVLMSLVRDIHFGEIRPKRGVTVVFTCWEEIGHGASSLYTLPCEDLIAVDMGCVGGDLNGDEEKVSICFKDKAGPYEYFLTRELADRCERLGVAYATDIYPSYSSDTNAALHAGMDARFACVGMGVFASHGYERTHMMSLMGLKALLRDCIEHVELEDGGETA
ncbi:MAG: M42 family metallopeptidase [Clostridia bacterium]|nr:M42 family metallopeptidase [Clostridia bacterium]